MGRIKGKCYKMTTLRIHRKENHCVDRYHNKWFADFVEYLKKDFDIDYVKYSNEPTTHASLQTLVKGFDNNPPLSDVDMIIENLSNNEYVCISFTEYFNSWIVHYMKSDKFKGLILTHFNYHNLYYWAKRDNVEDKMHLVKPWIFPIFNEFDVDHYRNLRDTSELTDGLFFKGSGIDENSYRKAIYHLSRENLIDAESLPMNQYLFQMAKSKVALSYYQDLDKYNTPFDYPGEFCYRDMEYMAVGVPFIRIEYRDSIYNGLYPNFHYISIPREQAYKDYEQNGDMAVSKILYDKYKEIKDDHVILSQISRNQREWFDSNFRWPKSAELAYQQLNIKDWL